MAPSTNKGVMPLYIASKHHSPTSWRPWDHCEATIDDREGFKRQASVVWSPGLSVEANHAEAVRTLIRANGLNESDVWSSFILAFGAKGCVAIPVNGVAHKTYEMESGRPIVARRSRWDSVWPPAP